MAHSNQDQSHSATDTRGCPEVLLPAPFFKGTAVFNGEFKEVKLSDYKGKYLVFFFYPLNFTFVCPTEIIAFSEAHDKFTKENCELLACSCDSHYSHLAFINTPRQAGGLEKLNFPLLSDASKKISQDYNVLLDKEGVSLRALFIIDPKGKIRQMTINDIPVGRSVQETLRLVQAIKFTDENAQVCPAGWKPGQDTIIPNQVDAREYFKSKYKEE